MKGTTRFQSPRDSTKRLDVGHVIEVQRLVKHFGQTRAVDGVSFTVRSGEIFGLLGPNGAGKTTTIRMLLTLLSPTSGSVRIGGLDIRHHGATLRHMFGYVPQSLSADAALSGYENLLVFAKLHRIPRRERRARIQAVLDLLDLDEAANRLVREYSGGMVRRLEIGQAILHRPAILVLDEPTLGLDPIARRSVWRALESLRGAYGMTLLVTTHYMEEADTYCDRVAIMHRGKIAAIGAPSLLKASSVKPRASLEDVFVTVTGEVLESGGTFTEMRGMRRRARRFH